ncbi:beta-glucuronidase [Reichenbachiella agariperforans]|uniref:Beta-glucuronidase n=1 Tax=Reichenbachiella agariperforans TaxID=156994 RepID=A0A1M6LIY6_REIAG|nr:glycoside hydrolase family 2 TIM barrel-domain containing protein [Reichenbachiella agariperforans]SHJ71144.1 beta-glucuronidase [Reichenbachiella agariperforans]
MKLKTLFAIVVLMMAGLSTWATTQNPFARQSISLNGQWSYIIDPYENGFYNYRRQAFDQSDSGAGGYYDNKVPAHPNELIEYDFEHAAVMDVPGDWNSQVPELEFYEGSVWLFKSFEVSPQTDKVYKLYFGAVNYEAHVYCNGKKVGMHKGGFTPFEFDVTDLLVDGDNFVVLKVDNTRHQDEVPTVNTDWWNYGGITRDVLLLDLPKQHVADYVLQLNPQNNREIKGSVTVAGGQAGDKAQVAIPELRINKEVTLDKDGKGSYAVAAKKVKYWSPESPKLYEVQVSYGQDVVQDQIGFRSIVTAGKDILLNGKSIFLKGISIHDENPLIEGRLRSEGDIRMMLQWAKELGCNFVRLAHYPHNEKMVRMAEQMGLMVWAEVPVYWTISWENKETFANAKKQLTDLIERDINRAAVMIWSVGNETPVNAPRLQFMGGLVDHVRGLDDTRLVAAALELETVDGVMSCHDPLAEKIDLISFNEYAGWYSSHALDKLTDIKFSFDQDKPVFISEFGAGAQPGYYSADRVRWSEEYQEDLYINQLKMLEQIDGLRGMTPWILVDFKSPRRPHAVYQNFWNRKGLISDTGKKKKAFAVLQQYYEGK